MKKIYLIFKILLILVALIAVAYVATPPDSEVILKRPWLGTKLIIPENTQGQYGDDLRIGVGDIGWGDCEIDGVKETAVVATLQMFIRDKNEENKTLTVCIGQSFEIDKYAVTVTDIHGELVSLRIQETSN